MANPSTVALADAPRFTSPEAREKPPKKTAAQERIDKVKEWKPKTDIIKRIQKMQTDTISTIIVECSGDMAYDLLTLHDFEKNRDIDAARIDQYKEELRTGNFPVNGDTVKFSKTHQMLDGQHRLFAIAETNVPLTIILVLGLEDKVRNFMDIGKVRTAHDTIAIHGLKSNKTAMAYCIKNLIFYGKHGKVSSSLSNRDVPNYKVSKFLKNQRQTSQLEEFIEAGKLWNKKVKGWMTPAQWAFVYFLLSNLPFHNQEAGQKKVTAFFVSIIQGTDLSKNSPVKLLRDEFIEQFSGAAKYLKRNKISSSMLTVKVKYIIEAWNYYFKKEFPSELTPDLKDPRIQKPFFR